MNSKNKKEEIMNEIYIETKDGRRIFGKVADDIEYLLDHSDKWLNFIDDDMGHLIRWSEIVQLSYHLKKKKKEGMIEDEFGFKRWYKNGELHREEGPAIEYPNWVKDWYINGQLHREDGPAVEHPDGTKYWYINGKELTEEEFEEQKWKKEQKKELITEDELATVVVDKMFSEKELEIERERLSRALSS